MTTDFDDGMAAALAALRNRDTGSRCVELPSWLAAVDLETPGLCAAVAARLTELLGTAFADLDAAMDDQAVLSDDEVRRASIQGEVEYLLDLAAYLEPASAEPPLRRALNLRSARLRTFAVASLLALGFDVDNNILESLGETPADRALLFIVLNGRGLLEAFPERWSHQDLLAEADMVRWLQYPTEMGFAPSDLVLVAKAESDDGIRYLFRFRDPQFLDGEWYVGRAGPYPAEGPPEMHLGDAWSEFERFDAASVEEHVATYLQTK
jgi:hypothetical protein